MQEEFKQSEFEISRVGKQFYLKFRDIQCELCTWEQIATGLFNGGKGLVLSHKTTEYDISIKVLHSFTDISFKITCNQQVVWGYKEFNLAEMRNEFFHTYTKCTGLGEPIYRVSSAMFAQKYYFPDIFVSAVNDKILICYLGKDRTRNAHVISCLNGKFFLENGEWIRDNVSLGGGISFYLTSTDDFHKGEVELTLRLHVGLDSSNSYYCYYPVYVI